MTSAQVMNSLEDNSDKYTHKKFGTRTTANIQQTVEQSNPHAVQHTHSIKSLKKLYKSHLFRPYALPDSKPRKKTNHELITEHEHVYPAIDYRGFASTPAATPSTTNNFTQPPSALCWTNPYPVLYNTMSYHYQFNPQIYTMLLQKQQDAMYMGEILKRQYNLNSCDLMPRTTWY